MRLYKVGRLEGKNQNIAICLKVKDLFISFEVRLCRTCQAQPAASRCVTSDYKLLRQIDVLWFRNRGINLIPD